MVKRITVGAVLLASLVFAAEPPKELTKDQKLEASKAMVARLAAERQFQQLRAERAEALANAMTEIVNARAAAQQAARDWQEMIGKLRTASGAGPECQLNGSFDWVCEKPKTQAPGGDK